VLAVVGRVLVPVTVARHIVVLKVDTTTLRQLMYKQVGHIPSVLLESIVAVIESVLGAVVVHHM
jgi:hypothetical protein|tara:strand:+ start:209 stop:400 length:192 start_codon:yes stop_codon:yes gene_type:complete